jgi:hypothetical protein
METEIFKGHFSKGKNTLIKIASIVGAIVVIAGGWQFYQNNFYKPNKDLKVLSVDYDKGTAQIQFKNDIINLIGDATWSLKGQWGIRFGILSDESGSKYNSLEITQSGMVYDYLDIRKG